ncbi:glycerophosphocholine cholinephosphodiesterase ENPP6-like [Mya arenaria]|uniref:glycerophosphocholine cholinephosphodiesterase ENPP6-like n=1 Tax=Mya arenaria TaxID=6604 RepID=UPI0022E131AD|nr:glycerophosphocholine cholinephosphodiesterase ENPP6-like [Mya arenaria]
MQLMFGLFVISVQVFVVTSNKLLLILVDGFRWDYFDLPQIQLRGFERLKKEGVRAKWLEPVFPANSFPNYKSMETGLYPESHGLVGNYIYNKNTGTIFDQSLLDPENRDPVWFSGATPFYISAEQQGKRVGLYNTLGCDIQIDDTLPSVCRPYDSHLTFEKFLTYIRDIVQRFNADDLDIGYMMYADVDVTGHLSGVNSQKLNESIIQVSRLFELILDSNIREEVNVVFLSDHGMASVSDTNIINITSVVDMSLITDIMEAGPLTYIYPRSGKENEVYVALKTFHPHMHVFRREDLHERWFFKRHFLVPPILLYADLGWHIIHPKTLKGLLQFKAHHGYDNAEKDMRGIFSAIGPDFKTQLTVPPIKMVDVYQLICHVTGIHPNPHNGTWAHVQSMLRDNHQVHVDL